MAEVLITSYCGIRIKKKKKIRKISSLESAFETSTEIVMTKLQHNIFFLLNILASL